MNLDWMDASVVKYMPEKVDVGDGWWVGGCRRKFNNRSRDPSITLPFDPEL